MTADAANVPAERVARRDRYAEALHRHVCGDPETCCWTEEGDACADVDLSDLAAAVMAVADEELAGSGATIAGLRAEVEQKEALLRTMDHFAEVAETCERKSNQWAAELRALREGVEALADESGYSGTHASINSAWRADLRALLAPSATTGEACHPEHTLHPLTGSRMGSVVPSGHGGKTWEHCPAPVSSGEGSEIPTSQTSGAGCSEAGTGEATAAQILREVALEVREATSIPITARATLEAVLMGRARRLDDPAPVVAPEAEGSGQHHPECNARCIGNRHWLLPWPSDPMRHQRPAPVVAPSDTEGGA